MKKTIAKEVLKKAKDIKNYLIMDKNMPVAKATGIAAAGRKVDKLDNAYGASKYRAELITAVDYSKKTVTVGGKPIRVDGKYLPKQTAKKGSK